jgi:four helix bundle protein
MSEQSYQRFTDLHTWQQARAFKLEIYELIRLFPVEEKYQLTDQLKRSARSICANIAEGHGRFTYKDQLHFCIQARGSLSETHNHIIDALDSRYIDADKLKLFEEKIKNVEKLLNGYITFLRNAANTK